MEETQSTRLLIALSDGQEHRVPELLRKVYKATKPSSARLSARIYDLRKKGLEINSRCVGKTVWSYKLKINTAFKKLKKYAKRWSEVQQVHDDN